MASTIPDGLVTAETARKGVWTELFKARLTSMVLVTTAVGYYLGERGPANWALLGHTLGGTVALAAGAAALNQYLEREHDARMPRTAGRPLPAGHLAPSTVLAVGTFLSVLGMFWLALFVNRITGLLGMLTLGSYIFLYTPLKRLTVLNTLVGAVPGALPPLMGWTASTGQIDRGGWALFTILFFWQLPHFMAIAWLYRKEYADAGYRMLSGVDPDGRRTASTAIRHTLALILFSLMPFVLGLAGRWYLGGAIVLGMVFLAAAIGFAARLGFLEARRLFFASILYLPLLLGLLVLDKVKN